MTRTLAGMLAVSLLLSGCASGGSSFTQGGWSDAVNSFGTDHGFSYSCSKYDPITGNMTDQVVVNRNLNPNAAVVAQTGAAIQGVIGLVGAIAKPAPAALAATEAAAARAAAGKPLDVPTCLGEHGVNTPMPAPPNPTPPPQPLLATATDHLSGASPDPLLGLGGHVGPGGHVRYLEAVDSRSACWRGEIGTEHCGTVADWLTWASAR